MAITPDLNSPEKNSDQPAADSAAEVRATAPQTSRTGRRRRWMLLALGCVVVATAAWYGYSLHARKSRTEGWLDQARRQLGTLSKQSDRTAEWRQLESTRTLLVQYLDSGGQQKSTANLLLCISLSLQGRLTEVDRRFQHVDPKECDTLDLSTAASILYGSGRGGLADQLIDEAVARRSDDRVREQVLRAAAAIRYDLGREKDVLAHCRELTKLAPDDPHPWVVIALVHEDRGSWLLAAQNYREVVKRAKEQVSAYRQVLVDFLVRAGEVDDARRELDRLKSAAPEVAGQQPLIEARLLRLEGKSKAALAIADRVVAEKPDDADAQLLRGQILFAQSEFEDAVYALERVVKADPSSHEAHYLLGNAYLRLGNAEKSEYHFGLHQRLAKTKQELFSLERIAADRPFDVQVRLRLVELYEQVGSPERAAFWRRAIKAAKAAGSNDR